MPSNARFIQLTVVISTLFSCAPLPKYSSAVHGQNKPAPVINKQVLAKLSELKPTAATDGILVIFRRVSIDYKYRWPLKGTLWLDEAPVGDVFDNQYNVLVLPQGRHTVLVRATLKTFGVETASLIAVPTGQTTYLELTSGEDDRVPSLILRPGGTAETVAECCTEGLNIDLGSKDGSRRRDPSTTQL